MQDRGKAACAPAEQACCCRRLRGRLKTRRRRRIFVNSPLVATVGLEVRAIHVTALDNLSARLGLPKLQGRLIGLKLMRALTANFCRFLCGHAATFVEIDRVVRHDLIQFLLLPFQRRLTRASPAACRVLIDALRKGTEAIFLRAVRHDIPHQGGLEIERVDVDDLEDAINSRIPTNPNPG